MVEVCTTFGAARSQPDCEVDASEIFRERKCSCSDRVGTRTEESKNRSIDGVISLHLRWRSGGPPRQLDYCSTVQYSSSVVFTAFHRLTITCQWGFNRSSRFAEHAVAIDTVCLPLHLIRSERAESRVRRAVWWSTVSEVF